MEFLGLLGAGGTGGIASLIIMHVYYSGKFEKLQMQMQMEIDQLKESIRQLEKGREDCSTACHKRLDVGEGMFREIRDYLQRLELQIATRHGEAIGASSVVKTLVEELTKLRKD